MLTLQPVYHTQRIYMSMPKLTITILLLVFAYFASAQKIVKGRIIDAVTKEPISGASIQCTDDGCQCSCLSTATGHFEIHCKDCHSVAVSFIGYKTQVTEISAAENIFLTPSSFVLNAIVVTASRGERIKRSEAPVSIVTLNTKTIQETKATSLDQVLNKVSGVNMVNLGNEQHQMSIRQPMTTKSLFLYLEDGIPVRTTGLFNHNALLEMNMAAVKNIEVIKGPSSSLYGSEAIGGVVNLTTMAPTALPQLKLSAQGNNNGYKRIDLQSSITKNKWGFVLSGYHADKTNGFLPYSDFHKSSITARIDYRFNDRSHLSNSMTWMNYYSDMPGGIDSTMFATKTFFNPQTFTYREVKAFRYRSSFTHSWNDKSKTMATLVFRDNTISQNPAYRIKDDYRRSGDVWIGKKDLAHGEINSTHFNSYAIITQHKQNFTWKNLQLSAGTSIDLSPSSYQSDYIDIRKDVATKKYTAYQPTDSALSNYKTGINNYAVFTALEINPVKKLRLVASLRYDVFHYDFDNSLQASSFSGSADTATRFKKLSPKVGFTYNFSQRTGIYANYSQGFVPPQVTEMFTGVKVPQLEPSVFYNYEVGGWMTVIKDRLSFDLSLYTLEGTNEIISVKLDDGSFENRNAGKTSHKGVEFGIQVSPVKDVSFRLSGAYSEHRFIAFEEKGANYSNNEMNNAPRWMHNAEAWYRPSWLKSFRIGLEWQKIGAYYMDAKNTVKYDGYDVVNLRTAYQVKWMEVWMNVMNIGDSYFSYVSTKSNSGYSYQLAEPRNFNAGVSIDIAQLLKK